MHAQLCLTLCDTMDYNLPGSCVHRVGDAVEPSHPPLSPSPPALNLSQHRVFSNKSALCIRWPKYYSLSISPSNEYSGFISFRTEWFDLLAVQGTLKSLLQQYNSKASILQCSAFFMVLLSHPYMTTGKNSFDCMDFCQQSDVSAF